MKPIPQSKALVNIPQPEPETKKPVRDITLKHPYAIHAGRNSSEIVCDSPTHGHNDADGARYYGGYLVAESIPSVELRGRIIAAYKATRNMTESALDADVLEQSLDVIEKLIHAADAVVEASIPVTEFPSHYTARARDELREAVWNLKTAITKAERIHRKGRPTRWT